MLGLGNALTTGSTRKQHYCLRLDGLNDYFSLDDVLDLGTGDFSLSVWIRGQDLTSFHALSKFVDANNEIRLGTNASDELYWKCIAGGTGVVDFTAGSAMTALENTWVHICVTADRTGNGTMYVNGETTLGKAAADMSEVDDQNLTSLDNAGRWEVGRRDGVYSNGRVDELAMWDITLDEDAVSAIYNLGKPINLNSNRGDYGNALDLKGYWRMGDGGGDDREGGLVFNQAHQIGPNLVSNPDFEDSGSWIASPAGSETCEISTTRPRNGTYSWEFITDGDAVSKGVSTDDITIELDTIYRFSYWAYIPSTNDSKWMNISIASGNQWVTLGGKHGYTGTNIPVDEWTRVVGYFKTASTGSTIKIKMGNGGAEGANGDVRYIDDVALVKLTPPPVVGPNLIANSSFESVATWNAQGGTQEQTTEQVHSGTYAWKFVRDGVGQNWGVFTDNITIEEDTVYKVSWWSYCPGTNSSGEGLTSAINRQAGNQWEYLPTGNGYASRRMTADTWTYQSHFFRTLASDGTTIKLRLGNGGSTGVNGDTLYFDDMELVKVGEAAPGQYSTSWFSTDTPNG